MPTAFYMKSKKLKVWVALAAALGFAQASLLAGDADKPAASTVAACSNSVNLLAQVRRQNGTPKSKPDLYVSRNCSNGPVACLAHTAIPDPASAPKLKCDAAVASNVVSK
jgi:hypothetical protein